LLPTLRTNKLPLWQILVKTYICPFCSQEKLSAVKQQFKQQQKQTKLLVIEATSKKSQMHKGTSSPPKSVQYIHLL
jgi:transcription elongation factor Elf1